MYNIPTPHLPTPLPSILCTAVRALCRMTSTPTHPPCVRPSASLYRMWYLEQQTVVCAKLVCAVWATVWRFLCSLHLHGAPEPVRPFVYNLPRSLEELHLDQQAQATAQVDGGSLFGGELSDIMKMSAVSVLSITWIWFTKHYLYCPGVQTYAKRIFFFEVCISLFFLVLSDGIIKMSAACVLLLRFRAIINTSPASAKAE